MEDRVLSEKCHMFMKRFDERLAALKTKEEKQQFIEGAVFALDGCFREGNLGNLTPLQREHFIQSMLANTYSTAHHQKLDPETHMRELIESNGMEIAQSYVRALEFHILLGIPVSFDEKMQIQQMVMIAGIEANDAVESACLLDRVSKSLNA
ncbi:hypothetical protein HY967_01680 [Candidatus Jorgensenbacteria bacterium]|nr:hypothetical protein [Candidatus Jorgensenbacteria bacterium]